MKCIHCGGEMDFLPLGKPTIYEYWCDVCDRGVLFRSIIEEAKMNWTELIGLHDSMLKHNPHYHTVIQTITEMHLKKSHDYASDDNRYSNFEYSALLAEPFTDPVDKSFAVLIGTKLSRLAELRAGKTPKNESIRDTFIDLANYACIWVSYYLKIEEDLRGSELHRSIIDSNTTTEAVRTDTSTNPIEPIRGRGIEDPSI